MERWKPVVGYEALYAVSDQGRVWSHRSKRYLKPGRMAQGHLSVALGRGNSKCVHALVLEAFVSPRPRGHDSRHLNGTPADNRLENLRWSTRGRNEQDKKWHSVPRGRIDAATAKSIKEALAERVLSHRAIAAAHDIHRSIVHSISGGRTHVDV